jgi:hypothetical protein
MLNLFQHLFVRKLYLLNRILKQLQGGVLNVTFLKIQKV